MALKIDVIGPEIILFADVCASFSPEILPAEAAKGLRSALFSTWS